MKVASLILGIVTLGFAACAPAHAASSQINAVEELRWLEPPAGTRAMAWARETTAASRGKLSALPSYPVLLEELRRALQAAPDAADVALLAHPSALYVPIGQPGAPETAFVHWARSRAVPLRDFPSNAAGAQRVADIVGSARMVSLGEPAHGAHEPLAFRNRLFQYLVEHHGFTAIALESGFSEARIVNDFVLGGAGDPREIARTGLTWGFGGFAENVELLRWMRAYNADEARQRKVKFYGIDLTGGDGEGRFAAARVTLDDALSFLVRVDPDPSARARAALGPFLGRFTLDKYKSLSADERRRFQASIDDLIVLLESQRKRLTAASTEAEYEWALRSAIAARQSETLFRLAPDNVSTQGVVAEFHEAAAARDAAMADNALWALRREGSSGRVLVFAHNAHVMNAPLRGGLWDVYPQAPAVMGQHLRSALGKDLIIIGATSATNGPGLPAAPSGDTTVDAALARVGLSHFMLDIREAPRAAIPWLQQTQSLRANFTTELKLPLPEAFDAIVHCEQLHSARTQ